MPGCFRALRRAFSWLVVPLLADWCLVTVLDENGKRRDVGRAHRDPALVATLNRYADLRADIEGPYVVDSPGIAELLTTGLALAGLARVDFFVEGERVLVNELNTLPGFTATSVYPKLWEATGLPFPELCDRLLGTALDRFRAERGGHAF